MKLIRNYCSNSLAVHESNADSDSDVGLNCRHDFVKKNQNFQSDTLINVIQVKIYH